VLHEQVGDLQAWQQWSLGWLGQNSMTVGRYGPWEQLANTSLQAIQPAAAHLLHRAGQLAATLLHPHHTGQRQTRCSAVSGIARCAPASMTHALPLHTLPQQQRYQRTSQQPTLRFSRAFSRSSSILHTVATQQEG
jgi:hypothetical protein